MTRRLPVGLRLRAVTGRWAVALVAALVVVALAGGYVTYATHVAPGTTSETRTLSSWETRGFYNYYAVVSVENSLYPVGTPLDGRSAFLKKVAPELSGQHVFAYQASDAGSLDVRTDLALVYREVDAGDGQVYWSLAEPLDAVSQTDVAPGQRVVAPFVVNASAAEAAIDRIHEEVGRLPGRTDTEAVVVATTHLAGTVNGERVSEVRTYELPVRFQSGLYLVDDPTVVTDSAERTQTVSLTRTYGPVRGIGAPAVTLLAVVGAVGLLVARRRGEFDLTDAEAEWLAFARARDAASEWITTGTLVGDAAAGLDDPDVTVASLDDLVDLAVDTGSRVVEAVGRDRFLVSTGGRLFVYAPPADPTVGADRAAAEPADASDADAAGGDSTLGAKESPAGGE